MAADEVSVGNPLDPTPEFEARVRVRAYHLWEADGQPIDRDLEYWKRAEELERLQDSSGAGLKPVGTDEPIEEALLQDNLGEFPDRFSDQGEHRQTPMTRPQARAAGKRS
jgi:hypothetical protein